MNSELLIQFFICLASFFGFARYLIGAWFKLKDKNQTAEHKRMFKTITQLDFTVKDLDIKFVTMNKNMTTFTQQLGVIVQNQAINQKTFNVFANGMHDFVKSANLRFEKLENIGKVIVKP